MKIPSFIEIKDKEKKIAYEIKNLNRRIDIYKISYEKALRFFQARGIDPKDIE